MQYQVFAKDITDAVYVSDVMDDPPEAAENFDRLLHQFTSLAYICFKIAGVRRYFNPQHLIYCYLVEMNQGDE